MKEYKERDRGSGIDVDPFAEDEELPYLTGREKSFCRLFLQYNENYQQAAKEVFHTQKDFERYGRTLLAKDKVQQYIKYLREDILEIKDAEGKAKYSIQARVKELEGLRERAESANNYQAAANFQALKETLIGKRRTHSMNLAKHKNDEDRRQALFDAVASGEMEVEEFKVLIKALQSREEMNLKLEGFRAEIPDNGRVDNV